jgi:endonuclease/exonuclease/phosphatase (EEP) superfamily protein YafD
MTKSITTPITIFLYGWFVITAIFSVGSLVWRNYPLELLNSFRVYYLLGTVPITITYFIYQVKRFRIGFLLYLSLALLAFNSSWILPWYLSHPQHSSGNTIRVLTFNINTQNDQWDAIAKAILAVKPDVATVIETSVEATDQLSRRLSDRLPNKYRTTGGGLTILSRFPLTSPESITFKNGTILATSLQINQRTIKVIAAHPIAPVKPTLFRRRNAFLAEIKSYLEQQQEKSLIFLGDLNLTPWSPHYQQLIHNPDLHNTRLGFGIEPSWIEPASYVHYPKWITTLVKIPIDHILVSQDLKVSDCQTVKAANSDHRILWSDLVL